MLLEYQLTYHDACAEELYDVFLPEVGDVLQRFLGVHPLLTFQCVVQLSDVGGATFLTDGLSQSVVCPSDRKYRPGKSVKTFEQDRALN